MTKLFAGLFIAALMISLGSAPTLTHAEEDAPQEAGKDSGSAEDSTKDETMMEKLEDALKETTTPTDEETDPIGTAEDADRDLY
jgi:hypothetical protein